MLSSVLLPTVSASLMKDIATPYKPCFIYREMNLWSGEKMRQAGLAMWAKQILNYWKATMWLPPEQTWTNHERGSQRSSAHDGLPFSPGACLSFVSVSIRGFIKEIVHAHSLTCSTSVDELTPLIFCCLSSTTGENKMGNWLVFGLFSYPHPG